MTMADAARRNDQARLLVLRVLGTFMRHSNGSGFTSPETAMPEAGVSRGRSSRNHERSVRNRTAVGANPF